MAAHGKTKALIAAHQVCLRSSILFVKQHHAQVLHEDRVGSRGALHRDKHNTTLIPYMSPEVPTWHRYPINFVLGYCIAAAPGPARDY